MKKIELIEKIEGEAKLHFSFADKKIDFVEIEFFSQRGIEQILKNKNALDALVINPRVCGICGHAHLIATVKALEDVYDNLKISNKAKIIRELTLNFEIIQNHFKWFYLTLLPLTKLKKDYLVAIRASQLLAKAIATLAGQYPHNSYTIVGGVVSDIGTVELIKLQNYIKEAIDFFERSLVMAKSTELIECENIKELLSKEGDLIDFIGFLKSKNIQKSGKSYDRFIVFGENSYFKRGKCAGTKRVFNLDINKIKEYENSNSYAKNVKYKEKYFEVGPLSRAMVKKTPLIKDSHRRFGDSIVSRVIARVCEIPQLLHHSLELIKKIDLNEASYIEPKDINTISGIGVGVVEAARGSLIHKVELQRGIIKDYSIITPTQWNLSNGNKDDLAIAQKAMIGLEDVKLAELIFKSFDVCSVCTTH